MRLVVQRVSSAAVRLAGKTVAGSTVGATGRFRAPMEVALVNDGPVTLVADF